VYLWCRSPGFAGHVKKRELLLAGFKNSILLSVCEGTIVTRERQKKDVTLTSCSKVVRASRQQLSYSTSVMRCNSCFAPCRSACMRRKFAGNCPRKSQGRFAALLMASEDVGARMTKKRSLNESMLGSLVGQSKTLTVLDSRETN
jgi:hypothetical protein